MSLRKPAVSESESLVLEALWRESPKSAEGIIDDVAASNGWTAATVKTLLNRLLKKKAIRADRDGRRYLYSPLVTRADYVQSESQGLIDRLFGGKVAPLVSHFSDRQGLSTDDIDALKKLVEDLENDR